MYYLSQKIKDRTYKY